MKTASLYVRLSKQATDSNLSLSGMTDDIRAHCQRLGLTEIDLHVDDGLSGGYRDRPAFLAWLADAREGRAQVLLTHSVDRLTREGLNVAAALLDVVEGKDPLSGRPSHTPVRLLDVQGIDSASGDTWRMAFVIKAEIARAERERMRQRSSDMHRRARLAGRWAGGLVPYGYHVIDAEDGKGKTLEIEPDEATAIREAVERALRGDTLGRVSRWMNHQGHKPRKAAEWSRMTLKTILTGTALLGQTSHDGRPVRDAEGAILRPYPAIVTDAEHAALRAKLLPSEPGPRQNTGRPARLLSGLLTCASCGCTLRVGVTSYGAPRYACNTRGEGRPCERPATAAAAGIEEYVSQRYLAVAGEMPMYKERVIVGNASDLARVDSDIKDASADISADPTQENLTRLQRLHERRRELASQDPGVRVEMEPTGLTGADWWASADVEDRREQLSEVFSVLALGPGQRGARGFDPDRLTLVFSADEEYED